MHQTLVSTDTENLIFQCQIRNNYYIVLCMYYIYRYLSILGNFMNYIKDIEKNDNGSQHIRDDGECI